MRISPMASVNICARVPYWAYVFHMSTRILEKTTQTAPVPRAKVVGQLPQFVTLKQTNLDILAR